MSFIDGITYTIDKDDDGNPIIPFTQARLLEITDQDIASYLNNKAFGTATPTVNDYPIYCRSDTLFYHKKALSMFMPRQYMTWDDVTKIGNPTKSRAANKVIEVVKKHEVQGTGKPSNARRAVEWDEFKNVLAATREFYSSRHREEVMILLLTILTIQWQFIGRIDDMMRLATSTVLFNSDHPFTLYIKMCWSKNIRTERDSPTQILFASMDPAVCPLLHLAVMMEAVGTAGGLMFGRTNKTAANLLKQVYESPLFTSQKPGKLGTHSIRKGPATFASRCGMPKEWINQRGRWRGRKQVVDRYIDVFQPYPDAKVAGCLCGHLGPCMYAIKQGVNIPTGEFLESITPHSCEVFGPAVAKVLALPLLWAAHEDGTIIPGHLGRSIREQLIHAGVVADGNPIEKIELTVRQNGDQLVLIPLRRRRHADGHADGVVGAEAVAPADAPTNGTATLNDVDVFLSQNYLLQQRLDDMKNEVTSVLAMHMRYMQQMNANIRRISVQPFRHVGSASVPPVPSSQRTPIHVKLSSRPPNLFVLWDEYEHGLSNQKPARDFTAAERGANKHNYSRRHVFWEAVEHLIARGHTSDTAIDRIQDIYGRGKSVTAVLNEMKRDRARSIVRY
ncbi:hypothetical protein ACHAWU_006754 [Discostella pseudostelligera]|uniref:Nucleoprotein n=1 Tax=Discostella pseudostelligera TaxID=259834 RepID=A0ABD3NC20_9STRA